MVRQGGNGDFVFVHFVARPHAQAAVAGLIQLEDIGARGDNFRFGGKIGPLDMDHQVFDAGLGVVQQINTRLGHFPQVVRRYVRRHAHGDPGHTVEQYVRQPGWQQDRLLHRAVKIRFPVDSSLSDFAEQHVGKGGHARFGIAHGGKRFGVVRRAEIVLTIHSG